MLYAPGSRSARRRLPLAQRARGLSELPLQGIGRQLADAHLPPLLSPREREAVTLTPSEREAPEGRGARPPAYDPPVQRTGGRRPPAESVSRQPLLLFRGLRSAVSLSL